MPVSLTSSMEDYLEAISLIIEEKQAVRPKDISKKLGVANSSVTGALHSLSEKKMIHYVPHDIITLTELGKTHAERIIRRHMVLRKFLVDILKVDRNEADQVACMMEHVITDTVYGRLEQLIDHIAHCPFNQADHDMDDPRQGGE